ncbi:hypothetical protein E6W36_01835 [Hankyongella ginsenosidimutans]|uniref:Transcriptional regulator-like domain-containing protein n=1 Tax=Hankyongella ginsenosidimutans TaxID=1763828 RepID=A0A4D7CB19_9SPHN|nr:DUF6499 domain-containing protein [Hankyongella ginsenosidimutans]QCI78806.1 hypothetical protein E6W36_01835 [Hankyongella ginsenosidimutans]
MTAPHGPDWRNGDDYARLRGIDRAGLMWEWLRRVPGYVAWYTRASTATRGVLPTIDDPAQWGFTFAECPDLAAPEARIIWRADLDPGTLHVVALPTDADDPDGVDPNMLAPWLTVAADAQGSSMRCCRTAGIISASTSMRAR